MAKILLVEDDNNLREIYGARLAAEGYDIVSANDGEEALAIAVKEKPDLVITDVMMPRISGFDMLDILRNAPETKDTKVIMMTALSQAEDKARADSLGADMYLVKSQVTLEDVAKAVHDILNPDSSASTAAGGGGPSAPSTPPATSDDNTPATSSSVASDDQSSAGPKPAADDSNPSAMPTPVPPPAEPPQPVPPPDQPQPSPPPEPEQPEIPPAPEEPESSVPNSNVIPKPLNPHAEPHEEPLKKEPTIPVATPPEATEPPANAAPTPASSKDEVVKPKSIPIKVVLPDDSSEDKSKDDSKSTAGTSSGKTEDTPKINIGPNLAEALADEENSLNDQIKEFEKKSTPPPPPAPPLPTDDSTVIKPTATAASEGASPSFTPQTPQQTAPELGTDQSASNNPEPSENSSTKGADSDAPRANVHEEKPMIEDDDDSSMPKKKVLQPSEDFLKGGPNIEELLQKEMANEAVERPNPNTVLKDPNAKGPKDPEQVIDEIAKSNEEINKIAL